MNRLASVSAILVAALGFVITPTTANAQDFTFRVGDSRHGVSIRIGTGRTERPCPPPRPICHPPIRVEVTEIVGYTEERVLTGYAEERVIVGYTEERVITGYKSENVFIGYKEERVLTGYTQVVERTFDVCTRRWTTVTRQVPQYQCRRVPQWECREVPQYECRQVPQYECRRVPQYQTRCVTATWSERHGCYGYTDCNGVFQRVER